MENNNLKEILSDRSDKAKEKLDRMMPPKGENVSARTDDGDKMDKKLVKFTEKEINAKVDGFKKVDETKYPDVVEEAEKKLGKNPNNGHVVNVPGSDGYDYKVMYEGVENKFLVFKGSKKQEITYEKIDVSDTVDQYLDNSEEISAESPKAEEVLKAVKSKLKGRMPQIQGWQFKGEENTYLVYKDENGIRLFKGNRKNN